MVLGADDRAVSNVVGATLIFGFLVIFLALYQATVVPSQNEQVEFDHSQAVQRDVVEVRNTILETAETGRNGYAAVTLGTSYPPRTIAINPPPVTGTLRTSGNHSFAVRNGTGALVTDEVCPGDAVTRFFVYEPNYHAYAGGPDLVYENSVVYERFSTGNLTLSGQSIVEGDEITIIPLQRSYSKSGIGTVALEPKAGQLDSAEVDQPSIELPTRLSESDWEALLDGQVDPGNVTVTPDGNVTIEPDGEYVVNCGPVGTNDVPDGGARGSGGTNINPAGPGDVVLEGTTTTSNAPIAWVTFNNTADEATSITKAKYNFYSTGGNNNKGPGDSVTLVNDSTGTSLVTLQLGGARKQLPTKPTLPGNTLTTIRFEFTGQGNVGVREGDFFIVELTFSGGRTGTYFVAPQE